MRSGRGREGERGDRYARERAGQKRGCEDPKRGAQDPDPDDGALKIAPSDGGALGILCLGRGRHRSRLVRWGAEDLSAPAGGWQIFSEERGALDAALSVHEVTREPGS